MDYKFNYAVTFYCYTIVTWLRGDNGLRLFVQNRKAARTNEEHMTNA